MNGAHASDAADRPAFRTPGLPDEAIRERARLGTAAAFPDVTDYGTTAFGQDPGLGTEVPTDPIDALRVTPPVFMPLRLEKLIDLAREPLHSDVELATVIGGFASPLPLYLSAFGSTKAAGTDHVLALSRQAGRLGIPMVVGENIMPIAGYGRSGTAADPGAPGPDGTGDPDRTGGSGERSGRTVLDRIRAYTAELPDGLGGLVVQQSTEDADAEVWNLVYSDPGAQPLLDSGRLAFELKTGQGAKPGLGGLTVLGAAEARRVDEQYAFEPVYGADADRVLRCSSPGTFTEEILRQQIHLMRNNYPRARVWVKLHPGRDIGHAAAVAWAAGADAVTVDGAEGGSGWAPRAFLAQVGLPLGECLARIRERTATDAGLRAVLTGTAAGTGIGLGGGSGTGMSPGTGTGLSTGSGLGTSLGPDAPAPIPSLLASGRIWEGGRAVKCLALGATAVGLGRGALVAVDEDPEHGLVRLAECLALELRLLISAVGKYTPRALGPEDLWAPRPLVPANLAAAQEAVVHE
ncbi:glutamate synthase-related protein [Streptomyces sp. NPDC090025]|uniref:glutamate synthase-related protein n=1 Tax=Streptomyces sp. NPDC090025 TaxID=3365922 RepID=UPI003839487B